MRHSEPSPAIHNVEMPGLTPSLDHSNQIRLASAPSRYRCCCQARSSRCTREIRAIGWSSSMVSERRVQISGGKLFPESTEAELIGAIDDEGVKVGWIVQGFQLELLTGRGPVLTSTVESVDVE